MGEATQEERDREEKKNECSSRVGISSSDQKLHLNNYVSGSLQRRSVLKGAKTLAHISWA